MTVFDLVAFKAAYRWCVSQLFEDERQAIKGVVVAIRDLRLVWPEIADPFLRGAFIGTQARRDRQLFDRLEPGSSATGKIFLVPSTHHAKGWLRFADFAETLMHEIDHALGFNETEVIDRAGRRRLDGRDIATFIWREVAPPPARWAPPRKRSASLG